MKELTEIFGSIKKALSNNEYTVVLEQLQKVGNCSAIDTFGYKNPTSILHLIAAHHPHCESESENALYVQVVESVLAKTKNINVRERRESGQTALLKASESGNLWLCTKLISHGAQIDLLDRDGLSALHHACFSGSIELVQYLLEQDPKKINEKSEGSWDLLEWLQQVPEIEIDPYDDEETPSSWYRRRHYEDDYVDYEPRFLEEEDADRKELFENESLTPLHCALMSGDFEMVKFLLKSGAHLNACDADGLSPMTYVAKYENPEPCMQYLKLFEEYGANFEQKDAAGGTPLFYAVQRGRLEVVLFLLEKGVSPASRQYCAKNFTLPLWDSNKNILKSLKQSPLNGKNPVVQELFDALSLKESLQGQLELKEASGLRQRVL